MTHLEMASTIRSRVADGLSGNIANQAMSLEQLLEEIDLQRAEFAHKYAATMKLDPQFMMQRIPNLEISCEHMNSECSIYNGTDSIPSVKIPKVMPLFGEKSIQFVGLTNMQEGFAVYFHPEDIRNHRVRIKTRHRPFVWVDMASDSEDMITLWFFNLGQYNPLRFVTVRAAFEHPAIVNSNNPDHLNAEYPAPGHMQMAIIDTLTEKYVRYYRQLNVIPLPNTQSDPIT